MFEIELKKLQEEEKSLTAEINDSTAEFDKLAITRDLIKIDRCINFLQEAQKFIFDKNLSQAIIRIISFMEKSPYIFSTYSFKEKDEYKLDSIIPKKDSDSYVIARRKFVEGKSFSKTIIVSQEDDCLFRDFSFSNLEDYKTNLDKFYQKRNRKNLVLMPNQIVTADFFANSFPYISDFLKELAMWRYQNKKISFIEEELNDMTSLFLASGFKKDLKSSL